MSLSSKKTKTWIHQVTRQKNNVCLSESCRNVTLTSPPCLWFSCTPSLWSSTGSCSLSSSSPPGWRTPELSFHPHCRSGFPFSDARPPYDDVCRVTFKIYQRVGAISWSQYLMHHTDISDYWVATEQIKHHVPAAAHHVARLFKVCDLVARQADFTSSRDTFARLHVLRHRSTFTWQQCMTETGRREKEQVGNILLQTAIKAK